MDEQHSEKPTKQTQLTGSFPIAWRILRHEVLY